MDKFGRNYNLYAQRDDGDILRIATPFTMEFDISRQLLGSANHGTFRVYNLDQENRNSLRFNKFNYSQYRSIKLFAGYGSNLSLIFKGNVHEGWSQREGVNFITTLECFDAGFAFVNSPFAETPVAGTDQVRVIKSLAGQMIKTDPNLSIGTISSSYSGTLTRANPTNGNSADLIRELGNGGFFVDNGKINCLQNNECVEGDIPVINAESGLLGTPLLESSILSFDMVFEPRLVVGQLILLQSQTDTLFRGSYKITSIKHRGMISPAVCGDAVTTVECLTGVGQLKVVA